MGQKYVEDLFFRGWFNSWGMFLYILIIIFKIRRVVSLYTAFCMR